MRKQKTKEPELLPTTRPVPEQLRTPEDLKSFLAAYPEENAQMYRMRREPEPETLVVVLRKSRAHASVADPTSSVDAVRCDFMQRLRALHSRDKFPWTISFRYV